jgi:hypothetical protein
MIDQAPSAVVRLRKLRADLKIKNGDLQVCARKLRRAQDADRAGKAAALRGELDKIKSTINDVRQTIVELEGAGVPA